MSIVEYDIVKLSTKSRYGLRIVIQVACDNLEGRLSQGREIAKNQDLTEAYIEQIMIPLKKAGIIKTERGCSGGYMLGKSPEDISIMDLIEVFEGKFVMSPCISGKKECPRMEICPATGVWRHLTRKLRESASTISIKDILEKKYA